MLNGREKLRKEYQARSYAAHGPGTYNRTHPDNTFHGSKKDVDKESDAAEVQQSIWMDTFKRGDSAGKMGIAEIKVDQRVVVM